MVDRTISSHPADTRNTARHKSHSGEQERTRTDLPGTRAAPAAGRARRPGAGLRPRHTSRPQEHLAVVGARRGGRGADRLRYLIRWFRQLDSHPELHHIDLDRLGRDPGGDGRALSRRRLEPAGRARTQRHPAQLRRSERYRRGRSDGAGAGRLGARRRRHAVLVGGLRLALRSHGQVLDVLAGDRERGLPAWRADRRGGRPREVHERLSRLLLRCRTSRG
ncbi:hypothetical protein SAMN04487905_103401 [Actinopolyspora xinjiangensis]|uniref:Uncharacterized protein n=1 Tax=Actinopolyspora xinjiangensis TaxID=405564 RepID=A0A1H0S662_9ACTN|nr:hypothetical protein SAMN04487905_103401 [Actinopolyspora xinjiangensis]